MNIEIRLRLFTSLYQLTADASSRISHLTWQNGARLHGCKSARAKSCSRAEARLRRQATFGGACLRASSEQGRRERPRTRSSLQWWLALVMKIQSSCYSGRSEFSLRCDWLIMDSIPADSSLCFSRAQVAPQQLAST